ncbi:MAG: DUF1732 domain-containing protein [Candidatus Omnitrophica bacterium]|nr:DUF1732 domain-containing protein [Candidatus Omnitrophota bacterium]
MRSMTAYASKQRSGGDQADQVILRSSNFKYLDICIHNLPAEDMLLEERIKKEIKKRVHRGKVEVFIFSAKPQAKKVYVDQKVVSHYITQIKSLSKDHKIKGEVNISDILTLPQSLFVSHGGRRDSGWIPVAINEALNKFLKFKEKEGKAIKKEIKDNLDKLKSNVEKIKKQKPKISKSENGKEDIDEELSLTLFYISKIDSKINSKKWAPQGRALDFLTQEILRELNAASSKTKKKNLALLIIEGKNYLERIKEQAQNIE